MWSARAGRLAVICLAAMAGFASACAYFNTLYNAKATFEEADKADKAAAAQNRAQPPAAGMPNPQARQYEEVVDKCKSMIANYPDSKHVDDAMLLSARALYALERYDEAVAALDSLQRRYPKSNLRDDAAFLKGKSLVAAEKYDVAAPVLRDFVRDHRKSDDRPEGLYLLCISLMQLGLNEEAVTVLQTLEKDHGRSDYRFKAQVEMADILAEKSMYDESLAVYRRVSASRIPESNRYDVWLGMARVQEQVGDYAGAVETLEGVRTLPRAPEKEPIAVLLRARAHAALDSTALAIAEYRDVTTRFARGIYASEAYYRLGEIYEGMDSLQAAQQAYQEVPRAYSGSEFAEDAIKRSGNIGRMLRVEQTSGDDSPEAVAMRTFSMAEIQLFQFESPQKAIPNYEKIVTDFPDSDYAPRAVYALGYIHGVVLGDTAQARVWYDVLRARYPDSAQMQLAQGFYAGAAPPPPVSEWAQSRSARTVPADAAPAQRQQTPRAGNQRPVTRPQPAAADSTRAGTAVAPDTTRTQAPAPADTARTQTPAPTPADTTSAPADTSKGS
ncbi:MAG TPA: tetratricopeptide repeat protein [Candidatus Krumholzibacteria bacterium]|nr:tetratricopeptide repeat protein [Candidatus Krumholzibacteria bacterium]